MYIEHAIYHVPYHVIITTKMRKREALLLFGENKHYPKS